MHNFTVVGPISFFRLRHFPNALVYSGRPRPALATPMAWHYSWHLIFFSLAVRCFFLHFPSDAISSSTYLRTRFSGSRRCVCSIVSRGLITAGTPTARCTRGGWIDSLITLRHRCWNTHGSNDCFSGRHVTGCSRRWYGCRPFWYGSDMKFNAPVSVCFRLAPGLVWSAKNPILIWPHGSLIFFILVSCNLIFHFWNVRDWKRRHIDMLRYAIDSFFENN